jgi:hypothetical protein
MLGVMSAENATVANQGMGLFLWLPQCLGQSERTIVKG